MDDITAIQLLKNGDLSGLEHLILKYYERAVYSAYIISGDAPLSEDIVQDAFIKITKAIANFDSTKEFSPWFYKIVTNSTVKEINKKKSTVSFDQDEGIVSNFVLAYSQGSPLENQIEQTEYCEAILDSLQSLSARQREVIVQRYYLEMTEAEMADQNQIAKGTVKWLLNAARNKFRGIYYGNRDLYE
jgi:RNA polymerase sigma-70 factor, ECF subfamily